MYCSTMGGGHNLSPLVEIWLTDLLKHGWAIAHPIHPSPTPLCLCIALLPMYTVHTYIVSRYVDYWKRQMKNFPETHPPYLLLSLFCFVFLSKGKIGPYHVQCQAQYIDQNSKAYLQLEGVVHQICDWAKQLNRHSSKSI